MKPVTKTYWLLLPFFVFALTACKKDHSQPAAVTKSHAEALIDSITSRLSQADSINIFTTALKNVKLQQEDISEGITVFIPINQPNTTSSVKSAGKNTNIIAESPVISPVPDSIIKAHIIKGIYKFSDLTQGKIVKTLAGRELIISKSLDNKRTFIDGVQISGNEILSAKQAAVYTVKEYLTPPDVRSSDVYLTEETYFSVLQQYENDISLWHDDLTVLDGILSHDVELSEVSPGFKIKYKDFGNFSFSSTNQFILDCWQKGYQYINRINTIEQLVDKQIKNQRNQKIAKLKALKAYIYLQLLSYYGNIAIYPEYVLANPDVKLSNTNRKAVVDYINNELVYAITNLGTSDQAPTINLAALKVLQAKLALLEKQYELAKSLSQEVLQMSYSLEQPQSIFTAASKEIIWAHSGNMTTDVKSYFYSRDILPYIRLTEVYLINAEANYMLGDMVQAKNSYDAVALRSDKSAAFNWTSLQQLELDEMKREGSSFIALVRWNLATDKLAGYGFSYPKNNLLPIPSTVRALNPQMIQNPKY